MDSLTYCNFVVSINWYVTTHEKLESTTLEKSHAKHGHNKWLMFTTSTLCSKISYFSHFEVVYRICSFHFEFRLSWMMVAVINHYPLHSPLHSIEPLTIMQITCLQTNRLSIYHSLDANPLQSLSISNGFSHCWESVSFCSFSRVNCHSSLSLTSFPSYRTSRPCGPNNRRSVWSSYCLEWSSERGEVNA